MGAASDWMADKVLRGLIGAVTALPYDKRVPAMGALVAKGIGPIAGYRRRAAENLALIYPQMPDDEVARISAAVCDNFGRTLIENYSFADFGKRLSETEPHGDGLAPLAQAKADGRPVIFVTGHFGNHEAPRQVLTRLGYDIGGLYRPMSNHHFNDHYSKTMTSWGGPVFAQGTETRGFARHIKSGGMGTLLFDVRSSKGIAVDFLGRPALTATSAADIALKFDALVIPYFATRQADGLSFDIAIETPITLSDASQMTDEMTQRLAARVRVHPDQWFWVHRRWK